MPTNGQFELQGNVSATADPALTIAGVTVRTDGAEFRDRSGALLGRVAFFSQARNQTVVARGTFAAGTLVATSLQLRP